MNRRMPHPAAGLAAAGLALALALAGCTATPPPTPPSPSTPSPTALSVDQVSKKIADAAFPTGSIAHTDGTIDAIDKTAVTIDVVALEALPDSTMLELRIATASGKEERITSFQFAVAPFHDTRNIGLVDTASGKTYRPYTYQNARDADGQNTGCLCDGLPDSADGTGILVSMIMPPLPDGTDAVDVTIPGMTTMKAVPVSRDAAR
ncbi:hypothetical protein [Microbacterium elymi]|uniref:DUF4352 domain-containing protein n=1 Tax=Microbacterium elymi TaxID=2909587 RepID=A0ABY5NMC3_9MICO|nr:hypothetical protein [Microbacterium elymi]UUT36350.1 hypothetical protein L2X98_25780 [Microbacterium elymi]